MKHLLKLEELGMFGLGAYLALQAGFEWWWFLVLLIAPDIGMLGYLGGNKLGAFTYNLFHHKAVALAVWGWASISPTSTSFLPEACFLPTAAWTASSAMG